MPDIGVTNVDSDYNSSGFESTSEKGIRITMLEAGTITSASAYIRESSTTNAHVFWIAVYDNSGNLVDYSESRQNITTTFSWVTFTGFNGAALNSGQTYNVIVMASGGSGECSIFERTTIDISTGVNISSSYTVSTSGATKATWSPPNPATIVTSNRDVGVYLTYASSLTSLIFQFPISNFSHLLVR